MVVRGAPAIAIAAALSLAVEVFNLEDFTGTPDEAFSFIVMKLEYLVSRFEHVIYNNFQVFKLYSLEDGILIVLFFLWWFFSRPTAVNLSDAAAKLRQIASTVAAATSDAKNVFEVLTNYFYNSIVLG